MGKEILTFRDVENQKYTFYCNKTPVRLSDIDIGKVLISNIISFGEKNYN